MLESVGKIVDNSDFSMPLVAFNTSELQVFMYEERERQFRQLRITDDDNLARNDMPRFFKTVYVAEDKFVLLGGLEKMNS